MAGLALVAAVLCGTPVAAHAAGVLAAYERYEPGNGFQLGLVNAGTGVAVALPAGVNTTADELHPALSADGRHLVFMRTILAPRLNGDVLPPVERYLFALDRQTGVVTALSHAAGGDPARPDFGRASGPSFAPGSSAWLARGTEVRSAGSSPQLGELFSASILSDRGGADATVDRYPLQAASGGQRLEVAHALANTPGVTTFFGRYLGVVAYDAASGATQRAQSVLFEGGTGKLLTVGSAGAASTHPVARANDNYVALDLTTGGNPSIQTVGFPAETSLTPAPAVVNTPAPERMPAWSPDGRQLAFVRTTAGRRTLAVFDTTAGIQTVVNPALDIGPDAPTPQLREYQSTWGGLSLGDAGASVPVVTCGSPCTTQIGAGSSTGVVLTPRVSTSTSKQKIGILVARVTGTRKLLGRTVERVRVVGRVPLGATRKGENRFRWNGRVAGRRLTTGTYLLTYRTLIGSRVTTTSDSLRFRVDRRGAISRVRRLG